MKELIEVIHRECGADFPISVRLTVDEFYEKIGYPEQGLHLEDGVNIARDLEAYGVNAINVTVGLLGVFQAMLFKCGFYCQDPLSEYQNRQNSITGFPNIFESQNSFL